MIQLGITNTRGCRRKSVIDFVLSVCYFQKKKSSSFGYLPRSGFCLYSSPSDLRLPKSSSWASHPCGNCHSHCARIRFINPLTSEPHFSKSFRLCICLGRLRSSLKSIPKSEPLPENVLWICAWSKPCSQGWESDLEYKQPRETPKKSALMNAKNEKQQQYKLSCQ